MTIGRRLRLAFGVLALSALGIALSNYLQYQRLDGDARAINLVGSQRMRSYRLATLAVHYAAYQDLVTADAIDAEIARFDATLAVLRDGDAALRLKPAPSPAAAAALEEGRALFQLYRGELRALLLRVDAGKAPPVSLATQAITAMGASLAAQMDRATSEFERASAAAVERYAMLQLGLFGATGLVALALFASVRGVLRRLPSIEEGFQELARGHLGARVDLGAHADEVAHLGAAFNAMSEELEQARALVLARDAELEQRNAALARADEHKSLFLATMSHELRTPLTSVIGFADLLRSQIYGPVTPLQADRLEAILRNARSLLGLVGEILDLAKIEAGMMRIVVETVAPGEILREVADSLGPLARAKGLELRVEVPEGIAAIASDPARARQVLLNLGSNAVKFTERGHVRLLVAPVSGGGVRFAVEDTGPGIAAADIPRLFRRFEQLDSKGTRRHGGTGLGLHVSMRIARLLGGTIEVESEPGRGSRFAFTLPDRCGGAPDAIGASAAAPEPARAEGESP